MPAPKWIPAVGDEVSFESRNNRGRVYGWVTSARWDGRENVVDVRTGDGAAVKGIPWTAVTLDTAPSGQPAPEPEQDAPSAAAGPADDVLERAREVLNAAVPAVARAPRSTSDGAAPAPRPEPTATPTSHATKQGANLRKLRTAIKDAGLTARTLREWAREHGIEVGTVGLPGWDVLTAYLDAQHADGTTTADLAAAAAERATGAPATPAPTKTKAATTKRRRTTATAAPTPTTADVDAVLGALEEYVEVIASAGLTATPALGDVVTRLNTATTAARTAIRTALAEVAA
jgi:hypothetical protein